MTKARLKKWLLLTALFVTIVIGLYLLYGHKLDNSDSQAKSGQQSEQKEGDKTNQGYISALGRVEPESKIVRLTAQVGAEGAVVSKLLVKEGDQIISGQLVAVLDGFDRQNAVVDEAETQVNHARRKLEQVKAGAKAGDIAAQKEVILRLEAEFNKARVELQRSEILYASGVSSTAELDERKLSVETLSHEIKRARSHLESLLEVRPTDIRVALSEIANAEAVVKRARTALEMTFVRSRIAGRVLRVNVRPGELVGPNGILELGTTQQMFVVAEVFEADRERVRIGQLAKMTVRSSNQSLQGTVISIGLQIGKRSILDTDPVADVDARVVEVRIRLNEDDSKRVEELTNLRVDVRIATD